jgi:hypothetical protein
LSHSRKSAASATLSQARAALRAQLKISLFFRGKSLRRAVLTPINDNNSDMDN